ncbi:hypothetical protein KP014_15540 [Paenibacillus sophorae]|uniref:Response regulatory domain-containing protein n=1 Tax=Paenibacillus sophorae TaxID=1333845 RepID=A0ABX8H6A9_9BACL|nr:hypothetical protein [Paenibacillus sophorae]QWU13412.1 hypothetical protein KP014_15540 [Paenibacillus sophorae]
MIKTFFHYDQAIVVIIEDEYFSEFLLEKLYEAGGGKEKTENDLRSFCMSLK